MTGHRETIAQWRHGRRDGTTTEMRATITGRRLVIARRGQRGWVTTREVAATDEAVRMLRRQGRHR